MLSLKNTIQSKGHVIISQNLEILNTVMQQRRKIQSLESECLNLKSRTEKSHQMHLDYIIKSQADLGFHYNIFIPKKMKLFHNSLKISSLRTQGYFSLNLIDRTQKSLQLGYFSLKHDMQNPFCIRYFYQIYTSRSSLVYFKNLISVLKAL